MKYLIIAGVIILLVVAALGVVGFRKSKKLFAEFTAAAVSKLPLSKAEILESVSYTHLTLPTNREV